jgi:adenine deaminase
MIDRTTLDRRIDQALSREPADLVIKNIDWLSIPTGKIHRGDIAICGDAIVGTGAGYEGKVEIDGTGLTAVPGFVDAHFHLESSMVVPYEFERCVLPHGTTTAVCDPHEMANVCGVRVLEYFLACAENMVMDLRVKLCSCVPSTTMETSGAELGVDDLTPYKNHPKTLGLAEMMNYPGVWFHDPGVMAKLAAFSDQVIDGHAPLMGGKELNAYIAAGIQNCHETSNLAEGEEKLDKGMRVFIRGGSVAKNLQALAPLINPQTAPFLSFCTDDRNPLDIAAEGHIDHMVRSAIGMGIAPELVYRVASRSGAEAFGLNDRGLIAPGCKADLVLLSDYRKCEIHTVLKSGRPVNSELLAARPPAPSVEFARHSVRRAPVSAADFRVRPEKAATHVIGLIPNSIITEHLEMDLPLENGEKKAVPANDILKVAVLERHGKNGNIGLGFVKGFGIESGAIASSIGHDSHNLCVVGTSDEDMAAAVNALIESGGGQCAVRDGKTVGILKLPLAGLMSDAPHEQLAAELGELRRTVRETGCRLDEPFLQLAFLPLPVIPYLKITDRGLVDVSAFQIIGV